MEEIKVAHFAFRGSQGPAHKVVTGEIEASSRDEAMQALSRREIRVVSLINLSSGKTPEPLPSPSAKGGHGLGFALAGGLISLGVAYLCWGKSAWLPVSQVVQAPLQRIRVSGQLQLPPQVAIADVQARVHLPEVPLDEFRKGPELLGQDGNFHIEFEYRYEQAPTLLSFRLEAPQTGQLHLERLPLNSGPDGTLTCTLPKLLLPAKKP